MTPTYPFPKKKKKKVEDKEACGIKRINDRFTDTGGKQERRRRRKRDRVRERGKRSKN